MIKVCFVLKVASGGHRKGITAKHTCCAGGTWYVQLEEQDMVKELGVDLLKDVTTCEVPYGGVLLMNNAIPHQRLFLQLQCILAYLLCKSKSFHYPYKANLLGFMNAVKKSSISPKGFFSTLIFCLVPNIVFSRTSLRFKDK